MCKCWGHYHILIVIQTKIYKRSKHTKVFDCFLSILNKHWAFFIVIKAYYTKTNSANNVKCPRTSSAFVFASAMAMRTNHCHFHSFFSNPFNIITRIISELTKMKNSLFWKTWAPMRLSHAHMNTTPIEFLRTVLLIIWILIAKISWNLPKKKTKRAAIDINIDMTSKISKRK